MPVETNQLMREAVDAQVYIYRTVGGMRWQDIVQRLGLNGESTARAMARRYAERNGLPPITQPNPRRALAGARAARQRWGATAPLGPQVVDRTFGVEIEYIGAPRALVARHIEQALGVPHIHVFGYHGDVCEVCGTRVPPTERYANWKVERDGSVPTGGEVVAPILKGEEAFNDIRKVTKAIRDAGGKTNRKCGLHIHIGVKDLPIATRAKLIENFWNIYPQLKFLVGKSRWNNRFAQPISAWKRADYQQAMAQGTEPLGTKYEALNIEPFRKIGTYEVRLHQGTLNANKIEAWVRFLLAFVENTEPLATHAQAVTNTAEMVDAVATALVNKENPLKDRHIAYLKGRAVALHRVQA